MILFMKYNKFKIMNSAIPLPGGVQGWAEIKSLFILLNLLVALVRGLIHHLTKQSFKFMFTEIMEIASRLRTFLPALLAMTSHSYFWEKSPIVGISPIQQFFVSNHHIPLLICRPTTTTSRRKSGQTTLFT
jgi:hypothetical protein